MANVTVAIGQPTVIVTFYDKDVCFDDVAFSWKSQQKALYDLLQLFYANSKGSFLSDIAHISMCLPTGEVKLP